LEPFVACLPLTAMLNVNTAPALVLAALDSSLTLSQGEAIAAARGAKGFQKLDEFWALAEVRPFTEVEPSTNKDNEKIVWEQGDFTLKSEFFTAFIRVDLADRIATSEILLKRDAGSGQMTTLYRDFSRREARSDTNAQTQPVADYSDDVQQALQ
ncbi:MAG: type II secretion system protein GspK, partial [Venatoribacter sp.]